MLLKEIELFTYVDTQNRGTLQKRGIPNQMIASSLLVATIVGWKGKPFPTEKIYGTIKSTMQQ
jgi:hypothetical protein